MPIYLVRRVESRSAGSFEAPQQCATRHRYQSLRVLAIPAKLFDRPVLGYLTRGHFAAILAAPDRATWSGHRDAVMLATAYNTGAGISEITALRVRDVLMERQTAVHLHGKDRKERVIPLWKNTATELRV